MVAQLLVSFSVLLRQMGFKNVEMIFPAAKLFSVLVLEACFLPTLAINFDPDFVLYRPKGNEISVDLDSELSCPCPCHAENQLIKWFKCQHLVKEKQLAQITYRETPLAFCWYQWAEEKMKSNAWTEPHLLNIWVIKGYLKNSSWVDVSKVGLEYYLICQLAIKLRNQFNVVNEAQLLRQLSCCGCPKKNKSRNQTKQKQVWIAERISQKLK